MEKTLFSYVNVCWLAPATGQNNIGRATFGLKFGFCAWHHLVVIFHLQCLSSLSTVWAKWSWIDLWKLWGTPSIDSSSETLSLVVAHADVRFAEHLLSTLGRGVARMQSVVSVSFGLPHEMCITYKCLIKVKGLVHDSPSFNPCVFEIWLKLKGYDLEGSLLA